MLDDDDVAGDLLQPLCDGVAMQRPKRERLENQQVERALGEVGFGGCHMP